MTKKIIIIHWEHEKAKDLSRLARSLGFKAKYESSNPQKVFQIIVKYPPDVVLIDLSCDPAKGARVAEMIKKADYCNRCKYVFINGDTQTDAFVKNLIPGVITTTEDQLSEALFSLKD